MDTTFKSLDELIDKLVQRQQEEIKKAAPYKHLFQQIDPSKDFTSSLQIVTNEMEFLALSFLQAVEDKLQKKINDKYVIQVLYALPFVIGHLTSKITEVEGANKSVEKAFFLVDQFIKEHLV